MIENVKLFVNELHLLIVVIIEVLVICFLYWYLYCKDRPLMGKVSCGGCIMLLMMLSSI